MRPQGSNDYPMSGTGLMNTKRRHLRLLSSADSPELRQPWTDAELVAALRRRDAEAAEVLYDKLLPVVDAAVRKVSGDRPFDYDDLVQIIFEQILKTILSNRYAQNCSLASWATLIASRSAINSLRARIRERRVLDRGADGAVDVSAVEGGSLERCLEARSEMMQLQAALMSLSEARREAVMLHDVFGYALADVADLTGVGIRAAQSRLFRGRRDLLKRLGKEVPSSGGQP